MKIKLQNTKTFPWRNWYIYINYLNKNKNFSKNI